MPIFNTERITIDGSQSFLGGLVYACTYNKGYNGQPSTVEVSIISETQNYQIPNLNYTSPYHIQIGGDGGSLAPAFNLKFFAIKYSISDGADGKVLNVTFQDGTNKLRRYWCAPQGEVCSHPNVILLGTIPQPNSNDRSDQNKMVTYSYGEFHRATAFLGIPNFPSNEFVRLNEQGTVLDIFNRFLSIYGYSWHLEDDTIKLIDVKVPIDITPTIDILKSSSRIISNTYAQDISNNFVKGGVALDSSENANANGGFLLTAATAIWDGNSDKASFLGVDIKVPNKMVDALYAIQSPEIYFAHIWGTYKSLELALYNFGYFVYTDARLESIDELLAQQTEGDLAPYTSDQAKDLRIFVCSKEIDDAQTNYAKDKALGEMLKNGYYVIKDFNPSVSWQNGNPELLNKKAKLTELPQFAGITFDNTNSTQDNNTRTINSLVPSDFVWMLSFPVKIEANYSDEVNAMITRAFFKQLPLGVPTSMGDYQNDKYFLLQVDTHQEVELRTLPVIRYSTPSIKYVQGELSSADDIRFQTPTYGLNGRKIVSCVIPPISDKVSNIELETFENLTPNFIAASEFNKNIYSIVQTDTTFECEIRGISIGQQITPEMGLDSVSIRLDASNGYSTTYQISSKRGIPLVDKLFKLKQKNTMN